MKHNTKNIHLFARVKDENDISIRAYTDEENKMIKNFLKKKRKTK